MRPIIFGRTASIYSKEEFCTFANDQCAMSLNSFQNFIIKEAIGSLASQNSMICFGSQGR